MAMRLALLRDCLKNNQPFSKVDAMKGGKREGAGRKKGIPNRASAAREAAIAASGLTPLEYMLSTMRDETKPLGLRLMAKAAAPYVHPRLASMEQPSKWMSRTPSITFLFVRHDGTR